MRQTARAAIYDLDGLMVDSEPLQLRAMNEALEGLGLTLTDSVWMSYVGRKSLDIIESLSVKHGLGLSSTMIEAIEAIEATKLTAYRRLIREPGVLEPMPGLFESVAACRSVGLTLAIASSSVRGDVITILEGLGLVEMFDAITAGDEVSHGKPDPAIFLETARRIAVPPECCLVLEDSPHGIAAASAAGMISVAIPNRFTRQQDFSRADFTLDNLEEFAHKLKRLI